jgi:hypothetical protein
MQRSVMRNLIKKNNKMKIASVNEKDSSVVRSWNYDYDLETLTVRFKSRAVYEYYDVPESTYDAFVKADSLGQFINSHLKGVYPYSRIK